MLRLSAVVACALLWTSPAAAWNYTGHKIIASIAFRQLSVVDQARLAAMLQRHPRFTPDFAEQMPADIQSAEPATQQEWLLQHAAVWPDLIRSGPPEKQAFHRGEWHYINRPIFLNDADRSKLAGTLTANVELGPPPDVTTQTQRLNIVQVIQHAKRELASPQASPADRALWLAWLCHTVGDIHQPLHSSALYSARLFPQGDRGGNSIKTRQSGNLHALWDRFSGQDDSYTAARHRAIEWTADSDRARLGIQAAENLDPRAWVEESHELAKTAAYNPEVLMALRALEQSGRDPAEIELSQAYLQAGGTVAQNMLIQAGYRLAALIRSTPLP